MLKDPLLPPLPPVEPETGPSPDVDPAQMPMGKRWAQRVADINDSFPVVLAKDMIDRLDPEYGREPGSEASTYDIMTEALTRGYDGFVRKGKSKEFDLDVPPISEGITTEGGSRPFALRYIVMDDAANVWGIVTAKHGKVMETISVLDLAMGANFKPSDDPNNPPYPELIRSVHKDSPVGINIPLGPDTDPHGQAASKGKLVIKNGTVKVESPLNSGICVLDVPDLENNPAVAATASREISLLSHQVSRFNPFKD